MHLRRAPLILALMAGAFPLGNAAMAQDTAEENGFKIGDGRLHPFFDLEGRYDTAAQINEDTAGKAVGVPDFIMHFRPGLKLDIPSSIFSVSLAGDVDYLYYLGLTDKSSQQLDRFEGDGNLDFGILKGSVVSFDLGDHFSRSDQSADVALTYGVLSLLNDAHASATIAPGGGALTVTPGYHFTLENFSPLFSGVLCNSPACAQAGLSGLDYLNHEISLENRWRFLPKTAILLDGEYDIRTYATPGAGNTPINFFKATTGITGLVTPHISTVARIGYGMDVTDHSYGSVIGQLEGAYLPNETTSIKLGYLRTFDAVPAPYITFGDDRGYLEGHLLLFSRLTLRAYGAVDWLSFNGPIPRHDVTYAVSGGADFEAARWLIIGLGDDFITRSSDSTDPTLNYNDDQGYLRFTFRY